MGATTPTDGNVHQGGTAEHLPPRLRLERLLDPATAFLELGQQPDKEGAPIVGIGRVAGRLATLVAEGGGQATPATTAKIHRAQEIAESCHLPLLYLLEGGLQAGAPTLLQQQARMAAAGRAALTVFFAPPTPSGMQLAALADESIATGTPPEMADSVAMDDAHALFLLQQAVHLLPAPACPVPLLPPDIEAPSTDLFASLFDEGYLPRFRAGTPSPHLGFAHVGGLPLGVVKHAPDTLSEAALADTAAFLTLCTRRELPLLEIGVPAFPPPTNNAMARALAAVQKAWAAFVASGAPRITLLPEGAPRAHPLPGSGPHFCWALDNSENAPAAQIDGFLAPGEARMVVALCLAACQTKSRGNPG